jgi:hypothetical protein
MHILLINSNPVVSRLFSMSIKDKGDVHLLETDKCDIVTDDYFDFCFVDDGSCSKEEIGRVLLRVLAGKKILLSKSGEFAGFDQVIAKPFLPSAIAALFDSVSASQYIDEAAGDSFDDEGNADEADEGIGYGQTSVLDRMEIDRIKQMLLEEGMEIDFDEDESGTEKTVCDHQPAVQISDVCDKRSDDWFLKSESKEKKNISDDRLLKALLAMKPKKIKKLLKGAKVHITIDFTERP